MRIASSEKETNSVLSGWSWLILLFYQLCKKWEMFVFPGLASLCYTVSDFTGHFLIPLYLVHYRWLTSSSLYLQVIIISIFYIAKVKNVKVVVFSIILSNSFSKVKPYLWRTTVEFLFAQVTVNLCVRPAFTCLFYVAGQICWWFLLLLPLKETSGCDN